MVFLYTQVAMDERCGRYSSVSGFNLLALKPNAVKGWLSSENELNNILDVHSRDTMCQFVSWHDNRKQRLQRRSRRRILWTHKDIPIDSNSAPFIVDRLVIKQCQYGKAHRRRKSNRQVENIDLHNYCKQRQQRVHVQNSIKVECDAKIVIRYVRVFNEEQYSGLGKTIREKKKVVDIIKDRLKGEEGFQGHERIYVSLPTEAAHTNHNKVYEI